MTSNASSRKEEYGEASRKQVDPYGSNLSEILRTFRETTDKVSNGIVETSTHDICTGPISAMSEYLKMTEKIPVDPVTNSMRVSAQYCERNSHTKTSLKKGGIPALAMD